MDAAIALMMSFSCVYVHVCELEKWYSKLLLIELHGMDAGKRVECAKMSSLKGDS